MHGATPALPYLREAMLFLIAAGIVVPLLHRWRVSPVLGYLLVGYLIGPYGLGLFAGQWPWLAYLSIPEISGVQALAVTSRQGLRSLAQATMDPVKVTAPMAMPSHTSVSCTARAAPSRTASPWFR